MKLTRQVALRAVLVVAVLALSVWLCQKPGTSFADRVGQLQAGMSWDEVEAVMGCPPGDYQAAWGKPCFWGRSGCMKLGGGPVVLMRPWNGEDGTVWVWGSSDSPAISRVEWEPHRERTQARTHAHLICEEVEAMGEVVSGWCKQVREFLQLLAS
jgi:hypothetical protein